MVFALVGLVVSAVFAGAALYVNAVEQPARLGLEPRALLAEWKPAYQNGTRMQAPLAILGFVLGAAAWWQSGVPVFLVAALAMIANIPWTLLVIFPINAKLVTTLPESANADTVTLVVRWGQLHAVRTMFGFVATGFFLFGLLAGR
jgi:hypothetical protein